MYYASPRLYGACFFLAVHVSLAGATPRQGEQERGRDIFTGMESLRGKLAGHASYLPPGFSKCANCHAGQEAPSSKTPFEIRAAPLVEHGMLSQIRSRRGGPPFAYDRDSFCHTLRTGIDPEYVILNRTMPRFEIDDAQCNALWTYLTIGGSKDESE